MKKALVVCRLAHCLGSVEFATKPYLAIYRLCGLLNAKQPTSKPPAPVSRVPSRRRDWKISPYARLLIQTLTEEVNRVMNSGIGSSGKRHTPISGHFLRLPGLGPSSSLSSSGSCRGPSARGDGPRRGDPSPRAASRRVWGGDLDKPRSVADLLETDHLYREGVREATLEAVADCRRDRRGLRARRHTRGAIPERTERDHLERDKGEVAAPEEDDFHDVLHRPAGWTVDDVFHFQGGNPESGLYALGRRQRVRAEDHILRVEVEDVRQGATGLQPDVNFRAAVLERPLGHASRDLGVDHDLPLGLGLHSGGIDPGVVDDDQLVEIRVRVPRVPACEGKIVGGKT